MKDNVVKKTSGMRASAIEDLTSSYEQLGVTLRRQLEKMVIFKDRGPWASIAFKYQSRNGNDWHPPRVMLAFFKNMGGFFTRYSYFNVKSKQEAVKIVNFLMSAFEIDKREIE